MENFGILVIFGVNLRFFHLLNSDYLFGNAYCHSPLPDWIVIADEWGSEEAMDAACGSPNGISITNLKTLNPNLK